MPPATRFDSASFLFSFDYFPQKTLPMQKSISMMQKHNCKNTVDCKILSLRIFVSSKHSAAMSWLFCNLAWLWRAMFCIKQAIRHQNRIATLQIMTSSQEAAELKSQKLILHVSASTITSRKWHAMGFQLWRRKCPYTANTSVEARTHTILPV